MKLIFALFSFVAMMFLTIGRALGFTDTNSDTASFTNTNMVPEYKSPGTRQWGGRLANNAAAAWRLGGREMIVVNQAFVDGGVDTKTYDTARDYRNKYIHVLAETDDVEISFPLQFFSSLKAAAAGGDTEYFWDIDAVFQITTAGTTIGITATTGTFTFTALNSGGFTIRMGAPIVGETTVYFLGIIEELRTITGA